MLIPTSYSTGDGTFRINGMTRYNGPTMPSEHIHDNYEVYYLFSGERNYFIKNKVYGIKPGDLVLIPKHIVHRTISAGVPSHERVVLNFKESYLPHYSNCSIHLLQPFELGIYKISLNIHNRGAIEELFNRMFKEIKRKSTGFDIYLKSLFVELLIFIRRCSEESSEQLADYSTPMHGKIYNVVEYINRHYMEQLSLQALASHFYVSTGYLSRVFKEVTGFTFREYLNLVRINEVQKQLRESERRISLIASEAGFDNLAHFGKVFKQMNQLSPRQYRFMNRRI